MLTRTSEAHHCRQRLREKGMLIWTRISPDAAMHSLRVHEQELQEREASSVWRVCGHWYTTGGIHIVVAEKLCALDQGEDDAVLLPDQLRANGVQRHSRGGAVIHIHSIANGASRWQPVLTRQVENSCGSTASSCTTMKRTCGAHDIASRMPRTARERAKKRPCTKSRRDCRGRSRCCFNITPDARARDRTLECFRIVRPGASAMHAHIFSSMRARHGLI